MSRIKSHIFDSLVVDIDDGIASQQIEYDQAEFLKGNPSPINEGITEKEVTSWDL